MRGGLGGGRAVCSFIFYNRNFGGEGVCRLLLSVVHRLFLGPFDLVTFFVMTGSRKQREVGDQI